MSCEEAPGKYFYHLYSAIKSILVAWHSCEIAVQNAKIDDKVFTFQQNELNWIKLNI